MASTRSTETGLPHPTAPLILSFSLAVLSLGFTSRNLPIRILGLLLELSRVALALRIVSTNVHSMHPLYLTMVMNNTSSMALQYLDSVLLSRWTFEAQGPTSERGGQKHIRRSLNSNALSRDEKHGSHAHRAPSRLVWGCEEAFRSRSVRSPWEVNHVPQFFPERPDAVPSTKQFLRSALWYLLSSFLILDVIGFMGRDPTHNAVNFATNRIFLFARLRDVTAEDILVRLISSAVSWVTIISLLDGLYNAWALVAVGLGLGRRERWPPLFNQWRTCWSIRQFWGSFWHQGSRQKFAAPAHFLCFSVLGLSKGSIVARYVLLGLTFAVSGCFHQLGDVASGVPWYEAGAFRFYVMQAFGIMVEDIVQAIFRRLTDRKRTDTSPVGWKRGVGTFWLLAWLIWTTPTWVYPVAQRSAGDGILPFSILRRFSD